MGESGLLCLGGFRNVRSVFDWEGLKLEIDETHYDFGTSYEIECESSDPDRARKLIEEFLGENGISYSHSEMNKFAVFRSGKLPITARSSVSQWEELVPERETSKSMKTVPTEEFQEDTLRVGALSGWEVPFLVLR